MRMACYKSMEEWERLDLQYRTAMAQAAVVNGERTVDILLSIICYLSWFVTFTWIASHAC
jgi:hypothetical protein